MLVEALLLDTSIECLDKRIVCGLSGLREVGRKVAGVCPQMNVVPPKSGHQMGTTRVCRRRRAS